MIYYYLKSTNLDHLIEFKNIILQTNKKILLSLNLSFI